MALNGSEVGEAEVLSGGVHPKLLSLDFDGTIALTSESAPGISTVNEAYAQAIDFHIGTPAADTFLSAGGHNHRTPAEITRDLIPEASIEQIEEIAGDIAKSKLGLLIDQIGTSLPGGAVWPRLTDGFKVAWSSLQTRHSRNSPVDTAIISAGHTPFIDKTFSVHGLEHPDILVTDDVLVGQGLGVLSPEHRAKPRTLPLDFAIFLWCARNKMPYAEAMPGAFQEGSVLHVGDDPVKDQELAANRWVDFQLLDPKTSTETWLHVAQWAELGVTALDGAHIRG